MIWLYNHMIFVIVHCLVQSDDWYRTVDSIDVPVTKCTEVREEAGTCVHETHYTLLLCILVDIILIYHSPSQYD